jgi:hypothetical protein
MKLFKFSVWGLVLWGAAVFVASCGGSSASNGTDSNTHWLKDCVLDSQCGSLSCICGVCSSGCESDAACAAFGSEAACEVPTGCGAGTTACVRRTGGGDGGSGGGGQSSACAAMDAHTGSLACATIVGYAYDGRICGAVACSCEGSECDQMFDSMAACDAAYADCYSAQGVLQVCSGHADCHVLSRTCCDSCGMPEPDTLIATYARLTSLRNAGACIGDPNGSCPACPSSPNPWVSARCVDERCELVDVTEQADCQRDDDCQLVSKDCCECPQDARSGFVAMSKNTAPSFCNDDGCLPCTHEPDLTLGVTCNTALGKCEMVRAPDVGCTPTSCTGLNEASCLQQAPTADTDGCQPRYGAPWPAEPSELQYAGCAQVCCAANESCPGNIDAEVCAADDTGACWTLSAPPVPQGWTLLAEEACSEVSACND